MIGWLYRKIFIAIVVHENIYDINIVAKKKNKEIYKKHHHFEGDKALHDTFSAIQNYIDESPLHYIAILNSDPNQGALSGCSLHDINEIEELSGAKTLCRNQKWMLYTSIRELERLKKHYAPIGLDYIFSPFSIIEYFFQDKISTGFALYALAQNDAFSIAFFDEGNLEYAHHYVIGNKEADILKEDVSSSIEFSVGTEDEVEKGIVLDELEYSDDLDIIDELDDLSDDIEDLDALDEISEFHEDEPTPQEQKSNESLISEVKESIDRNNNDFYRFELIQKTLSEFYAGAHCRDRFVETIYIADAYGSSSELKRYLEEELFLSVLIRRIDLGNELLTLAMIEEEGL
ncbi:MAG: hypothetical protein PHO27_04220 [Sulfuricurvum sp.]|nr:hypothetical protein [Sulfuricurvum sp.]